MQRGEVPNGRKDDSVPSCKGLDPNCSLGFASWHPSAKKVYHSHCMLGKRAHGLYWPATLLRWVLYLSGHDFSRVPLSLRLTRHGKPGVRKL